MPLLMAGTFVAVGGRIVTSATVGANIGGGGVLLVAPLVLPLLVIVATLRWWRILRSDPAVDGAVGRGQPHPVTGRHTRSAVGLAELPFGIAVEIELTARLR